MTSLRLATVKTPVVRQEGVNQVYIANSVIMKAYCTSHLQFPVKLTDLIEYHALLTLNV